MSSIIYIFVNFFIFILILRKLATLRKIYHYHSKEIINFIFNFDRFNKEVYLFLIYRRNLSFFGNNIYFHII